FSFRSNAATLGGAAAVVGNRGDIADHGDLQAGSLQGTDRALTSGTGALDIALNGLHAMLHRGLGSNFGSALRGRRSALTRAAEVQRTSACPGNGVALGIGNGDDGVVERALNMSSAGTDIFAFLLLSAGLCTGFRSSHFSSSLLLLVRDSALGTFAGTRIGLGALAAARQALAMADATVALDLGRTLAVQRD